MKKQIACLNDAVQYAVRLGFAKFQGNIDLETMTLYDAVDDMIAASGQKVVDYKFSPFYVKYNRNDGTFSAKVA